METPPALHHTLAEASKTEATPLQDEQGPGRSWNDQAQRNDGLRWTENGEEGGRDENNSCSLD